MATGIASINQDYPTVGFLKVPNSYATSNASLYLFNIIEWNKGHRTAAYAVGATLINSNGSWVNDIFVSVPATYVVVVLGANFQYIINPELTVSAANTFSDDTILSNPTPVVTAGEIGLGTTTGFGNGEEDLTVSTTDIGTGSGPTVAYTIVGYIKININGVDAWIPYMQ